MIVICLENFVNDFFKFQVMMLILHEKQARVICESSIQEHIIDYFDENAKITMRSRQPDFLYLHI